MQDVKAAWRRVRVIGAVGIDRSGPALRLSRRVVIAALPAACADPPAAPRPIHLDGSEAERVVLDDINALRARNGQAPLRLHPLVTQAAMAHAREMLDTGEMTHRGRDGSDTGIRLRRAGYAWIACRENLAAGVTDPRRVVAMWMRSGQHRENVLAANVSEMGVGHATAPGTMAGGLPRSVWALVLAQPR